MNSELRDVVLKPIINRRRNHQQKKPAKGPRPAKRDDSSDKTFSKQKHSSCQLGVEGVCLEKLQTYVSNLVDDHSLEKVAELKEKVLSHVKDILHPMQEGDSKTTESWFNRLDREDVQQLLQTLDPMSIATSKIMSLPDTLTKMYSISNLDLQPTTFQRDHLWLSLQWSIDGVENPFMSRPCMSQPCLGRYICGEDGSSDAKKCLPEMVPIRIIDRYREYRSQGLSTSSFKEHLENMRTDTKAVATNWCLGRDVWSQPRCILCYISDTFTGAADCRNVTRKEMSLEEYRKYFLIRFEGMRPDLMIDFEEYGFRYVLRETGVMLPKVKVPLPSAVVSLLIRKRNNEIVVDQLYPPMQRK